jgi:glycosyltransferase involved in cell wall biosynthesis
LLFGEAEELPHFVSILIPCFNAESWIRAAIESALGQSWPNKEVIVVDDGSTDGSLDIIRGFDGRILWETGLNRGGNAARNRLLALSNGDWLQYLDADDWLMPGKIADQVAFLEVDSKIDILYGPATLECWSEAEVSSQELPIPEPHDPWILLARWFLPQTGAPLWRKQAIIDVGGWSPNQPCCQEHELYLRLLMAGKKFSYCDSGGAVYRQWSDQTVCRRDIPLVNRQRLEIKRRAEAFLRSRRELTPQRLAALNTARFEIARGAWQYDKDFAIRIMDEICRSEPTFSPRGSTAVPPAYQLAFRLFGFRAAEKIAEVTRRLRPRLA